MTDDIKKKIDVVFIAGGKFHDIDFARLEILKLLAEDDRMKVRVFEDYSNLHAIEKADFLLVKSRYFTSRGGTGKFSTVE